MQQEDLEYSMRLKDVWLGYKPGEHLVRSVNASISPGEMIALVGRNGTGKSTLLRTIAGIQPAVQGDVLLNGRSIGRIPPRERSLLLSFVSTGSTFTENLTVFEMVSLGRHPYTNWWGALRESDRRKITESIRFVGMEKFLEASVNRLSDGERQRVMIAMALAQDTQLMVLDEPTAFLDIPNRIGIVEVLYRLKEEGHSVIFSTHDFDNVFSYADKIWAISDRQLLEGSPEDLGLNGAFEKLFNESKVAFDYENLRFVRRRVPEKQIVLDARDETVNHWTARSLERIGYQVLPVNKVKDMNYDSLPGKMEQPGISLEDSGSKENMAVRAGKNEQGYCWSLVEEQNEIEFKSLYELTGYLRRMK